MMIPRRNGNGLDFWDEVLPDSFFTEKETKIMKTDLKEKDGKYLLEIDVPGYDKEDIKIELHDGYLTVSAEKNEEKEDKHAKYLKRERFTGMCSRSYYVGENVTEEEIWNSCKTVGVDHFIKTLPGGLHSEIGDTDTVSGGEKQLLTIARGMLEDAPFLILDEATSNVDTRTEELVQQAMDKLTEGKTSFIIAHRLSTIKNADIILVMKDGNIIETGNHEELIAQNGFYADLYNSQFEL